MRWWFALKQGWEKRAALKSFLIDPAKQIHALSEITPEKLDGANIAILVLDFDGVLAGHDVTPPSFEVEQWLINLCQVIGEQRVAILTNQPKPERVRYFTERFPSILLMRGVRKKPFPDGLLDIANYRGVSPHRVVLVDDRLLTGMLATCLAYTQGWYFSKPKQEYRKHPLKEVFFSLLRVLERWLILFPFCF